MSEVTMAMHGPYEVMKLGRDPWVAAKAGLKPAPTTLWDLLLSYQLIPNCTGGRTTP